MNNKKITETQAKNLHELLPMSYYPLVTVITAVYNGEKYLNECILSILNQSYKNFEYIIIDGGSTDGTVNIIKQYKYQLAYWISQPDQGIYDAWNKALIKAKGDWIVFVGSDDELYPDALQRYIEHIIQHPRRQELEFISSHIELVDENLNLIRVVGEAWAWQRFQREMITWHVGTFHSKDLFAKYGFFGTAYKISGDYELLIRPKDKLITSFINYPTAKMRIGGVSSNWLFKAINETYQAKIKNGVLSTYQGNILMIIDKCRLLVRQITGWKNF